MNECEEDAFRSFSRKERYAIWKTGNKKEQTPLPAVAVHGI